MPERFEAGGRYPRGPAFEAPVRAVAFAAPAFFVVAAGVRGEEDATRFERAADLAQYSGQLAAGHMKERRVREDPVEPVGREGEREKVLLEHLAPRDLASRRAESATPVEPHRLVSQRAKPGEIAPRAASEIEDPPWRRCGHGP